MNRIGFDNEKYVKLQSQNIRDRISQFGGKLYLEFGGKLFDDYHAARVLPGFEPDSKVKMLLEMKDDAEIVIVLSADDIERSKRRGDPSNGWRCLAFASSGTISSPTTRPTFL